MYVFVLLYVYVFLYNMVLNDGKEANRFALKWNVGILWRLKTTNTISFSLLDINEWKLLDMHAYWYMPCLHM